MVLHAPKFIEHYRKITEQLHVSGPLLSDLVRSGIITKLQKGNIQEESSQSEKVRRLLVLVDACGVSGVMALANCLSKSIKQDYKALGEELQQVWREVQAMSFWCCILYIIPHIPISNTFN